MCQQGNTELTLYVEPSMGPDHDGTSQDKSHIVLSTSRVELLALAQLCQRFAEGWSK